VADVVMIKEVGLCKRRNAKRNMKRKKKSGQAKERHGQYALGKVKEQFLQEK
jgi:hypothetical protein